MSALISNSTLYDLPIEGLQIADLLMENEGELTPELEARLDALMQLGPDKIESAAMIVRSLEANAEVCKAEAQRLTERAKSFEVNAERLKVRMVFAVDAAFAGKVKTARFTVWTQKSADRLAFDLREEFTLEMLESELPEAVRIKKELNRAALEQLHKTGKPLHEAIYIEEIPGKRYLRIK